MSERTVQRVGAKVVVRSIDKITQQVLNSAVPPDELWLACTNYIENGNLESFRALRRKLFDSPVVATAATFPAFICPERFPMVDRQITRWASENSHLHRYPKFTNGESKLLEINDLRRQKCSSGTTNGRKLGESGWIRRSSCGRLPGAGRR